MNKGLLTDKAARLADASAIAAIQAATLARLGYPDSALEDRAARLADMAATYGRAARLAH